MKRYDGNAKIQACGCDTLWFLAQYLSSFRTRIEEREERIADATLTAMRRDHDGNENVQEYAMNHLICLRRDVNTSFTIPSAVAGILALMAMRRHHRKQASPSKWLFDSC